MAQLPQAPDRICFAMRKRLHGAKTIAGSATAIRFTQFQGLAMKRGPSVDFCGYWQRRIKGLTILDQDG
jgi:hypothetical protein